jgi:hypothetical protein
MDKTRYEFTVTVSAEVLSGFPMPIYDESGKIIGAFTQHYTNSLRCFVAATGWGDSIHLEDQFWFTPTLNESNIVVSGHISAIEHSNQSIKVKGAGRNYE